ncbi:MAG: PQQ-dependent dehydrogenase, methanol/ethanol family [Blastocatellia bacterium]|nr:MAG: PQQ-dependent dehydrogenase, methanol/ethanol family [Blastocatellia bacterium]
MPATSAPDGELHALVAYLKAISVAGPRPRSSLLPAPLPPIGYADLLAGFKNPARWLSYSGDYTGSRHSPLTQITPANVSRLAAQWTFQTDTMAVGRGFEATPIVVDGIIFITGARNYVWAIDALTGRPFWTYRRELPDGLTSGALYPVNRGLAVLGDRLFMVTLDAHLVALDAANGAIAWEVPLANFKQGYSSTPAPLVVKDKVIIGSSGGEFPTRGFIAAFDAANGKPVWRFNTIPDPGQPGSETWPSAAAMTFGGGAAWVTGTYDPESNLLYWGTGNPSPDYYGDDRTGDNLYTCSLLALDADTGALKWHYQFTPHDTHDWDANHVPVLADLMIGGRPRKVVIEANRNGFFYTLDRTTGELLVARPFIETSWAREIGADGRPIVQNESGSTACLPDYHGATNFMPPSYDPPRRLFFVTARETCVTYVRVKTEVKVGQPSIGGGVRRDGEKPWGALRAIDPTTGERRWEFRHASPTLAGVMSTASGVVFAGNNEGEFMAFDATTGRNLWRYQTGAPIWGAAATTYMIGGRQYVLIPSGTTLTAFALPQK